MELSRLAVEAGQLINRAVQYTGESLGQADKTELEPGLEELLNRAEATKTRTEEIINQTEVLLQPSPGARVEERLYERLQWNVPPRPRASDLLGDHMIQAGMEIGSTSPYGKALLKCGEVQKHLGEAERKLTQSINIHFINPLRRFTEDEYTHIQNERRMLVNKRLDLDVAKSSLRKAQEAEHESRNLNSNPLEDDYLSHVSYMFSFLRVKWLKIWAQEIAQAEMELRICQNVFDRQSEITKSTLQGLDNTHSSHANILSDFVEAQASFFSQCHQQTLELQKQLNTIPAVLCSNNWRCTLEQTPSCTDDVTDDVTPLPVVVHQLQDFDQDSWTLEGSSLRTENKTHLVTTQQQQRPDRTNNNNTTSTSTSTSTSPPSDDTDTVRDTTNISVEPITESG